MLRRRKYGGERDAPPLSRFLSVVLGWDYLHLLQRSKSDRNVAAAALTPVKDTFLDVGDYLGVFEPLLFEELREQIARPMDEQCEAATATVPAPPPSEWEPTEVKGVDYLGQFQVVTLAARRVFVNEVFPNDLFVISQSTWEFVRFWMVYFPTIQPPKQPTRVRKQNQEHGH